MYGLLAIQTGDRALAEKILLPDLGLWRSMMIILLIIILK